MKHFLALFLLISMSISTVSAQIFSSGPTYNDVRVDNQNIRIYTAQISTDAGKYGIFGDFQSKLVTECEEVVSAFDEDVSDCESVSATLRQSVAQLITRNTRTIRSFLADSELSWWIGDLILPDTILANASAFSVLGSRTYKNGVIFLGKQFSPYGGADIDNYYVGFIRYDAKYREIKGNMMPLAPQGSPQYVTYGTLYSDVESFESDVIKAFRLGKFSNKNTQKVYSIFLQNLWTN